ncbi:unnamed protein product [Rotaria magnacalcarata]|uniref:Uncharacterized protein n=1 Tax=Rotaria magnacalcarata TaxID=392030 RepID=A0A8S2NCA4_9BILA|nr:unnamed protein product [Rotaria magnacalcarata]CAF3999505.1 unnamed protein product [Rotaria magnacalcarata]
MTTVTEDKLSKVINSTAGTFLRGTMAFPKNEKFVHHLHPVHRKNPHQVVLVLVIKKNPPVTTNAEGTIDSPSSQTDQQYQGA